MSFKQSNPLSRKTSPINRDWIKGAIKRPGAFRKKAEEAGMSTKAFAEKVTANKEDYSARTGKQAELAETLMGMSRHESGHKNPEQGDFDYEDPNYKNTPEYKKFKRKQKRQERKNKKNKPKRGEAGFEQDPQEAAMEKSYKEKYGEGISRKSNIYGDWMDAKKSRELDKSIVKSMDSANEKASAAFKPGGMGIAEGTKQLAKVAKGKTDLYNQTFDRKKLYPKGTSTYLKGSPSKDGSVAGMGVKESASGELDRFKNETTPGNINRESSKDGKKGDLLSKSAEAAKKAIKKVAPKVKKGVKAIKKFAKEQQKVAGTGGPSRKNCKYKK